MSAKENPFLADVQPLLADSLQTGNSAALERYLTGNSNLPGPRMNLPLVAALAQCIGEIVTQPDPPVEQLEYLLDGWAGLPLAAAPVNDPREMLPACAVMSYGRVAVVRPDWWGDEVAKLRRAAANPRWRTREIVASAVQGMLENDWLRTVSVLHDWLLDSDPLVIRAAAAAIAEPSLLTTIERGTDALAIQAGATTWLARIPPERRREENVRVLRQALGYTVSVAVAAAPDGGFGLLETLAAATDADLYWVVRENLKKHRLARWPDRIAAVQSRLPTSA